MTATQRALVEARHGLCALCQGSGNQFCQQNGHREWWPCQACGCAGVRLQHGPAALAILHPVKGLKRKARASIARAEQEAAPGHTDLMVSPESLDKFLEENPPPAEQEAKHE